VAGLVSGVGSLIPPATPEASVIVFTADFRIVFSSGQTLTRLRPGSTAIEGALAPTVLGPGLWQSCQRLFRGAIEGRAGSIELEVDDGRWYLVDAGPLRSEAGEGVNGVCFVRDITEHKQLIDNVERQGRLLDLAHDGIIVREPATSVVTYWNREASEIYGYTAEEAHGRISHELLATEFPQSREAVDDALAARDRWEGDLWHECKDGRRIVVSSRQALVRDEHGEPLAIIELNSDITERRRAEQELRAAEQRFRGMVESAPDAMVIVDRDGVIVLVNEQAEELFLYPRSELVGQPVEKLVPLGLHRPHATHREGFMAEPRTRPMGAGLDLRARRKDGTEFMAEISLSPLRSENGVLVSAAIRNVGRQLLRQLERALVPRMRISDRWHLAWRYRPTVDAMLLGGDFIGVCERPDGSLSLLIGDVTGHGPTAAGTGAMLRAAWLGAAQADIAIDAIPELLDRLLINQADRDAAGLATVCLAEVDESGRELRLIRAGHDAPLLITPDVVAALDRSHGPALGLGGPSRWPLHRMRLPRDCAIMLFTDGLTERRATLRSARLGFDELLPRIDPHVILDQPPASAVDQLLVELFPHGTEQLDDDLAVILLNLGRSFARSVRSRP
jgi:PAS domain S-box-containing protein